MNPELRHRLQQLHQLARSGDFGPAAAQHAQASDGANIPPATVFLDVVEDFRGNQARLSDEGIASVTDLFCQLFIMVYRESRRADPVVAEALLQSFIEDFPGAPDSCLYSQWEALAYASQGFKVALLTQDRLLLWQQSLQAVQTLNEFLSGLIGYYVIAWRVHLGRTFSYNVLYKPYGAKVNEFKELTGGENGPFYLLFRLMNPKLRNAIAHKNIWLDNSTNVVKYASGKNRLGRYEMSLIELVMLAGLASHIPLAYLAGIATSAVHELGDAKEIAKLPQHLVSLLRASR
jgi:hypothetical protein